MRVPRRLTRIFNGRSAAALLATPLFLSALGGSVANASVLISIDKSAQQMVVSIDGERKYTWPVSTGASGYSTPSGQFTPFRMEKDHFSKEFDDAPMPNSIFFTMKGHAIHGTLEQRHLGNAVSHGCVRLSTAHAQTLFALVKDEGMANTKVVISGSEQSAPLVASRRRAAPADEMAARSPQYEQPPYAQPPLEYGRQVPQQYRRGRYVEPSDQIDETAYGSASVERDVYGRAVVRPQTAPPVRQRYAAPTAGYIVRGDGSTTALPPGYRQQYYDRRPDTFD